MRHSIFLALQILLVLTVQATWHFDYSTRGADWGVSAWSDSAPASDNKCAEPDQQSPINLMKPIGSYGWAYGQPVPFEQDNFIKHYFDSKEPYEMRWIDKNLKMKLNDVATGRDNYIVSDLGVSLFRAPAAKQIPSSFHFHTPSEHTLNGQVFDIEMHVSHTFDGDASRSQVKKSDLAILFSVHNYDTDISSEEQAVLDSFFELMNLDGRRDDFTYGNETVSQVLNFKEAMDVFDFDDRWVYVGSSTRPPCTKLVYRHILRKVYPISYKYLLMIKHYFESHKAELGGVALNSRTIFPVNGHQVHYIGARWLQVSIGTALVAAALMGA